MSYENAVPKPLKFLISDGKMIDDAGNVIAESDTLKDLYTKWNPEVKKYLLSDGSVVDENNNLIVKNDYYKKIYDQAEPKVAKYLHADGTIDENPGGGGSGSITLYAWQPSEGSFEVVYLNVDASPLEGNEIKWINYDTTKMTIANILDEGDVYTRISDTEFSITTNGNIVTFTRDSTKDVEVW